MRSADECPYLGITWKSKNLREGEMMLPSYAWPVVGKINRVWSVSVTAAKYLFWKVAYPLNFSKPDSLLPTDLFMPSAKNGWEKIDMSSFIDSDINSKKILDFWSII